MTVKLTDPVCLLELNHPISKNPSLNNYLTPVSTQKALFNSSGWFVPPHRWIRLYSIGPPVPQTITYFPKQRKKKGKNIVVGIRLPLCLTQKKIRENNTTSIMCFNYHCLTVQPSDLRYPKSFIFHFQYMIVLFES